MAKNSLATKKDPLIEINEATVMGEDGVFLNKVSLKVYEGEHLAVLGPNGAGKSSLIKLITGEYRPVYRKDNPPVKLFGEDRWDLFTVRKSFGIVTGDLQNLYRKDVTGLDVAISGYFGSIGTYDYQEITDEMRRHARKMLKNVGVEHLEDKCISRMSHGEAKKALIARALVNDPKVLIFDEPTINLDPKAIQDFLDTTRKTALSGRTIIMVTHHINEIIPEIERVVMIKEGKIFLDAPKGKALTSKNMSALFDTKLKVHKGDKYYTISYS